MPLEPTVDPGTIQNNDAVVQSWVADGTPTSEPVTTETPAPAPAAEAPAETVQVRLEGGRFGPKVPADAVPAGAQPIPRPAAAPAPTAAQIQDFIDAQLGEGQTFQIPRGVRIPLKRGDTVEYRTIEELQTGGMLELDYRHKTADLGRSRRELEQQRDEHRRMVARAQEREKWLTEREAEMRAAQQDPDRWAAWQEVQRQYAENPNFKKIFDDALETRLVKAENEIYRSRDEEAITRDAIATAKGWVVEIGREYPGVNPARVERLYGQALSLGQATLDPASVRAIYQSEADYLTEHQTPLQTALATLTAEVAALKGTTAAGKHNKATDHALRRAGAPPVATTSQPPGPGQAPKPTPFGINELPDRNSAWSRQR